MTVLLRIRGYEKAAWQNHAARADPTPKATTRRALEMSGKTSKRCPEGLRSVLPRKDAHSQSLLTLLSGYDSSEGSPHPRAPPSPRLPAALDRPDGLDLRKFRLQRRPALPVLRTRGDAGPARGR